MLQLSPTKQESRPEILGRRRRHIEGRILGTELIFTFPSGFINRMVRPLHLAELDGLVASPSFCDLKDFCGVFLIRQVFLEIDKLMIHGPAGILEALLELRDLENIMDLEFFRELKSIRNFSSSSTNFEWTDVSRSQLSFDTKTVYAFHGSDTKVNEITRDILHVRVISVIIALLATMSNLQIFKNDVHILLRLSYNVRAKPYSFSCTRPTNRSSAFAAIEILKWCHLQTFLEAVVVREFSIRKTFFPLHAKRDDASTEHILQNLIDPFNLSLRLRVVSCQFCSQSILETFPEL